MVVVDVPAKDLPGAHAAPEDPAPERAPVLLTRWT